MTRESPAEDPRPQKVPKPNSSELPVTSESPSAPVQSTADTASVTPASDSVKQQHPDLTRVSLATFAPHPSPAVDVATLTDTTAQPLSDAALANFHAAVRARGSVCVLLAAGNGTRFDSDFPKAIHPFAGRPLAQHVLDEAANAAFPIVVVVGSNRERVVSALDTQGMAIAFVCQESQMGTGHAVYLAAGALPSDYDGDILVAYADNPGIDSALLEDLLTRHANNKTEHGDKYAAMIVTGSRKGAGKGAAAYGRIVRKEKDGGHIVDIVEKKTIVKLAEDGLGKTYGDVQWSAEELDQIDEFNSGIVVATASPYLDVLGNIVASQTKLDPPKYEYYATSFVEALLAKGLTAEAYKVPEAITWKLEGANTVEELEELGEKLHARNTEGREANAEIDAKEEADGADVDEAEDDEEEDDESDDDESDDDEAVDDEAVDEEAVGDEAVGDEAVDYEDDKADIDDDENDRSGDDGDVANGEVAHGGAANGERVNEDGASE